MDELLTAVPGTTPDSSYAHTAVVSSASTLHAAGEAAAGYRDALQRAPSDDPPPPSAPPPPRPIGARAPSASPGAI